MAMMDESPLPKKIAAGCKTAAQHKTTVGDDQSPPPKKIDAESKTAAGTKQNLVSSL